MDYTINGTMNRLLKTILLITAISFVSILTSAQSISEQSISAQSSSTQNTDIWEGVYTAEQATQGQIDYNANCASCHALDLRGNSNTPSLLGMSFMFIWEGKSLAELYAKMRDEMPSDRPASLSQESYEGLLAFLLQSNSFPAGNQILSADNALLQQAIIRPQDNN